MTEEQQPDPSERMNANTIDAVLAFLEVKIGKHELSEGAGNPLITGVKKIADVDDDVPGMSLDNLDVDALIKRFRNKNSASLTDGSAQAYASRFRRALTMYTNWRNDEPWNVGGRQKAGSTKRNGTSGRSNGNAGTTSQAAGQDAGASAEAGSTSTAPRTPPPPTPPRDDMFDYIVDTDDGHLAVLRLPRRYTKADATRMKALIDALARTDATSNDESNA